ncbi:hypothetical protein RZS08_00965, partial [Arthrospira platensis SPKY1]|nr:hypothetical protein [Arthrospira platensis SPKY1]
LSVHLGLRARGVALADHCLRVDELASAGEHLSRQPQRQCAQVFAQVVQARGAGNGNDVFALGQHPGQSQLRGRAAGLGRQSLVGRQQGQVLRIGLWRKARHAAP